MHRNISPYCQGSQRQQAATQPSEAHAHPTRPVLRRAPPPLQVLLTALSPRLSTMFRRSTVLALCLLAAVACVSAKVVPGEKCAGAGGVSGGWSFPKVVPRVVFAAVGEVRREGGSTHLFLGEHACLHTPVPVAGM